jgi:hypothetical protein
VIAPTRVTLRTGGAGTPKARADLPGWRGDFVYPIAHMISDLRCGADESRCRRQHVEECFPVVAPEDPVVEDHHGATVG